MSSRVSKITIGRLYNLGNFEHVRYELSAEVGEGDDVSEVFRKLESIITNLKPKGSVSDLELSNAMRLLEKPASQLQPWEIDTIENSRDTIKRHEEHAKNRKLVIDALNELGGSRQYGGGIPEEEEP